MMRGCARARSGPPYLSQTPAAAVSERTMPHSARGRRCDAQSFRVTPNFPLGGTGRVGRPGPQFALVIGLLWFAVSADSEAAATAIEWRSVAFMIAMS